MLEAIAAHPIRCALYMMLPITIYVNIVYDGDLYF